MIIHKFQPLSLVPAILAVLLLALAPTLGAATEETGVMRGTVNFCGKGGVEGLEVYVPGKPYVIITDKSGKFEFTHLPFGRYTLVYRHQGRVLNQNNDIEVSENKPALLGEIRFCETLPTLTLMPTPTPSPTPTPAQPAVSSDVDPAMLDKDGDGFVAAKDCRDDDPSIRPGAREICDGVDNDCDGKIDNLGVTSVEHGVAICQAGALKIDRCDKGFADCDGKNSNGCEVDLMNDESNCGACGNICTLEICSLGSC